MRPDTQYAADHNEWTSLVDSLNDKFNYTLARPMAHVLASIIPGAKGVEFPMPLDWKRAQGDMDARRFAFTWLPTPGETELNEQSRILSVSGEMSAGQWLLEEGCLIQDARVGEPLQVKGHCHQVLIGVATRLPWMRGVFPDAPKSWEWEELYWLLEDVQEILISPGASLTIETVAPDENWKALSCESRFFFDEAARELDETTPPASDIVFRQRRM